MGMVVRTNNMAINANRQLGTNQSKVSKSLEKLSSGFKINRAGDDAAGLAISEKMKAQIKGLDQAAANSQDGISLIQTAEGALTETHDMLNRMVELATKSANGTIQDEVDREAIQKEVDALNEEITRISKATNFNGINLIDGSLSGGAQGSGALNGGITANFKSATKTVAGGDMSGFTDFDRKEIIKVDGVDIEVDWSKVTPKDQTTLKTNWSSGSISTTEAGDAAKILQDTINSAIDEANKTRGTNVKHIEVKGSQTDGNASFKITSGMTGSKDSGIEINASSANGVMGTMVAGYVKFAEGTQSGNTTKALTFGANSGLNGTTTKLTTANIAAIKAMGEVVVDGDLKLDLSKIDLTTDDTADAALAKINTALNDAITKHNKAGAEGDVGYTKYEGVSATSTGTTNLTLTFKTTAVTVNDPAISEKGTKAVYSLAKSAGDGTKAIGTGSSLTIEGKTYNFVATATGAANEIVAATSVTADAAIALAVARYNSESDTKFTATYTTGTFSFTAKDPAAYTTADAPKVTGAGDIVDGTNGRVFGSAATETTAGKASAAVKATAEDKFAGDIGEVNGIDFDMVLGGEKFNINVSGIDATADKGVANAKAIKTAIDATLDKYIAAKGMNAEEGQALKDSITVEFTKDGRFSVTNNTGKTLSFADKEGGKAAEVLGIGGANGKVISGGLTLQIGDTNDDFNKVTVSIDDMSAKGLATEGLNVSNQDAAGASVKVIKDAINKVSSNRATLGALQNRLEHTINNLNVTSENMTSANSAIRDTDMAKEMMEYTKMNVLTQAAQAMLAQANQQPQAILQLLQ